jgi:hypothetical protein
VESIQALGNYKMKLRQALKKPYLLQMMKQESLLMQKVQRLVLKLNSLSRM